MSTIVNTDTTQPLNLSYEIIIAHTPEERQQCYDIRIEVFHHEQKFPLETEIDEMEDKATHFLLRLTPSLTPVGTVRAFKVKVQIPGKEKEKEYYKLTRLAVLKAYRRYRLGYALVQRMHDWVLEDAVQQPGDSFTVPNNLVEIILHSQIPAKAFYAKFGYEPQVSSLMHDDTSLTKSWIPSLVRPSSSQGPEFDEDGDPHQKMVLHMPMPLRPSRPLSTVA